MASPRDTHGRSRRAVVLAVALAVVVVAYALAQALVSRPAVEARLRTRIAAALHARVGDVRLGDDVHVDALFRVTFGPLDLPGARAGDPPVIHVDSVKVRADALALFSGRVEPASIRLAGVRVAPGPGGRGLEALLARARAARPRGPAPAPRRPDSPDDGRTGDGEAATSPAVHVRHLVVVVPLRGRDVELGPVDGDLSRRRDGGDDRVDVALRLAGGGRVRLGATQAPDGWRAQLHATGLGPELVPKALRADSADVTAGALAFDAEGTAAPDLSRAEGQVRATADGVFLSGPRIAAAPVGPLRLEATAAVAWDGVERRVSLEDGTATLLWAMRVLFDAEARLGGGVPFSGSLRAEGVDYRSAVEALPPCLAPPPEAPRPGGTFDARLAASGALLAPASWTVTAELDLARMREVARRADPVALRGPFVHHPDPEEGGRAPAIVVGPRNPDFVPVAELPEHVVRAVTTAEDAGFFGHAGFDFEELKNAFAAGAEKGRVVRGGSTITQQLAKNLYLSREKTLARKVREAAVTLALEASLPKRRLLEIYLNVAEWGPGLHGIGPAARHWFGKDARALTPKEAAFLASVIPNPVRYHGMFARRAVSDAWEQRVTDLLFKMTEQGALSDDQLVDALREPIVFAGG